MGMSPLVLERKVRIIILAPTVGLEIRHTLKLLKIIQVVKNFFCPAIRVYRGVTWGVKGSVIMVELVGLL